MRPGRRLTVLVGALVVLDLALAIVAIELAPDVGGADWGDLPSWLAAVGTVGAFVAAFIQIAIERKRRREAEVRAAAELRREQARRVSAYPGPIERPPGPVPPDQLGLGRTGIDCMNASDEPIYNVVICLVFIQGAAPRSAEKVLEVIGAQNGAVGLPVTTVSVLPPGRWRAWLHRSDWLSFMQARAGSEIAFTDRSQVHWIRRANGDLQELPVDPLNYFQQFGLYPPYDFQTPERLA